MYPGGARFSAFLGRLGQATDRHVLAEAGPDASGAQRQQADFCSWEMTTAVIDAQTATRPSPARPSRAASHHTLNPFAPDKRGFWSPPTPGQGWAGARGPAPAAAPRAARFQLGTVLMNMPESNDAQADLGSLKWTRNTRPPKPNRQKRLQVRVGHSETSD